MHSSRVDTIHCSGHRGECLSDEVSAQEVGCLPKGGICPGVTPGMYPLGKYPPEQVHPPGQVHTPDRYTPWADSPTSVGTPSHSLAGTPPGRYTPRAGTPRHSRRSLQRTVWILLECFLSFFLLLSKFKLFNLEQLQKSYNFTSDE